MSNLAKESQKVPIFGQEIGWIRDPNRYRSPNVWTIADFKWHIIKKENHANPWWPPCFPAWLANNWTSCDANDDFVDIQSWFFILAPISWKGAVKRSRILPWFEPSPAPHFLRQMIQWTRALVCQKPEAKACQLCWRMTYSKQETKICVHSLFSVLAYY